MNAWYLLVVAGFGWLVVQRRRLLDQVSATDPVIELQGAGVNTWYSTPEPDGAWLPFADQDQDTMPDQLPTIVESIVVNAQEAVQALPELVGLGSAAPDPGMADRNLRAVLDMIAYAEGTGGPNGYRTLFGGGLFDSFADHPRKFFTFTNKRGQTLRTSAAGRYQFLSRTWDELAKKLELPDFGPESQDRAAVELIRQRGALADVQAGRIAAAVTKIAPIWASLPGANYAQPERKLSDLVATYQAAGGNLEA